MPVGACRLNVAVIEKPGAAREGDDRRGGILRAHGFDDGGDRPHAPTLEESIGKYPCPALEKLDGFSAGLDLLAEELGDGLGQNIDEWLKNRPDRLRPTV
jgi:hypothetical protein